LLQPKNDGQVSEGKGATGEKKGNIHELHGRRSEVHDGLAERHRSMWEVYMSNTVARPEAGAACRISQGAVAH
jgi:hypothetical protein